MPVAVPVDYGIDVQCWPGSGLPDLDPNFTLITGNRLLMEICLRRLFTERGSDPNDPHYGYNLLSFLNSRTDNTQLPAISAQVVAEVQKDERISGALCEITNIQGVFRVRLNIQPAEGPSFQFVLAVDATTEPATFALLFPGV
jgi:hypothetical protein